nr:immunoglobulin light chain junction region [Macaca mulatta]MOV68796.1 immunoglobulin light chain junction region [Macaca mulatta]MOV69966.1 immunoglobulin light chain junction region [Macaca mulatta]MOW04318.1 immunoglobulin light chain junction region [Macaca mulatta]MOX21954.1 immunoglobulin light chain junction region [Macaca mulatta]
DYYCQVYDSSAHVLF